MSWQDCSARLCRGWAKITLDDHASRRGLELKLSVKVQRARCIKLVEGERFVKLLVGWLNDHRDHLRDANDVAKRKRRATMHKLVSEKRTIRGTDPWSAEGWIGR